MDLTKIWMAFEHKQSPTKWTVLRIHSLRSLRKEYLNYQSGVMWGTGSEESDWNTHSIQGLNEDPHGHKCCIEIKKKTQGPWHMIPNPHPPNTENKFKFCPQIYPNEKPFVTVKMSENVTVKQNCEISQEVPMGYLIMSHWHFKVIKKTRRPPWPSG